LPDEFSKECLNAHLIRGPPAVRCVNEALSRGDPMARPRTNQTALVDARRAIRSG
jgi:hypothetical protein